MIRGDAAFDVVVIGGGTAGCVLAARLSEDTRRTVALIEAGPDPRPVPPLISDPARQGELVGASNFVRRLAGRRADGTELRLAAARVIGGGSSVNNLAATRPMDPDFAAWAAAAGDPRWSYERLLPVLRALEDDRDFGNADHHGRGGPVPIEHPVPLDEANPAIAALLAAAAELGLPRCDDVNVPLPFGVCGPAYTSRNGVRVSTADSHLVPARARPNLTVLSGAAAAAIVGRGSRSEGVEVVAEGTRTTVGAERVVVSAGVFGSPQLLLLSGVGAPADLERLGVPVWLPLPGVGRGLRDHAVVPIAFSAGEDPAAARLPKLRIVARSDPDRALPDLHVFVRPVRRSPDGTGTMPVSIHLLEHRATGRLTLTSTDPLAAPVIEPHLAEHPDDVRALVDGIALAERLAGRPSLGGMYGPLLQPGPGADRAAYVRAQHESYQHGVGTCRFGRDDDPDAVVGPDLRLRGIDNVWVADASVLPSLPHANPNIATMLVAEVAAESVAGA